MLYNTLFILLFAFLMVNADDILYDNSENVADHLQQTNVTACKFEVIEHFVLQKNDEWARMSITSSDIFKTILNQLEFLAQITPAITVQSNGQWVTEAVFSDIFRYTQLLSSEKTLDMNLCNHFCLFVAKMQLSANMSQKSGLAMRRVPH